MSFSKRKPITVAHSSGIICGKRIDYRLVKGSERNPIYRIRIAYGSEISERSVSSDISRAVKLYGMIVKNLVTPCTFDDIIEDNL
ncbi:MAG: hypothetical protein IJZ89_09360 [Clostridia bacterium]|nr:hypothetical protein [Clostridia bacterium]